MPGLAGGLSCLLSERAKNSFNFLANVILRKDVALVSFKVNFYAFNLLAQAKRCFPQKVIRERLSVLPAFPYLETLWKRRFNRHSGEGRYGGKFESFRISPSRTNRKRYRLTVVAVPPRCVWRLVD